MKARFVLICAALALLAVGCCKQQTAENIIKTPVPARPAGQTDVLGLTAEPIETVRIGVVGLGMRGSEAVWSICPAPKSRPFATCCPTVSKPIRPR